VRWVNVVVQGFTHREKYGKKLRFCSTVGC
jgi:hypothetical protein